MTRSLLIVLLLCGLLLSPAQAATPPQVRVFWDGTELTADAPPILVDGRTLMPVAWFHEYFGGRISCTAYLYCSAHGGTEASMQFQVDSRQVSLNGHTYELDVPVVQVDRGLVPTIYIPLRFVATMLGGEVTWVQERNEVQIAGPLAWPERERTLQDDFADAMRRLCELKVLHCR